MKTRPTHSVWIDVRPGMQLKLDMVDGLAVIRDMETRNAPGAFLQHPATGAEQWFRRDAFRAVTDYVPTAALSVPGANVAQHRALEFVEGLLEDILQLGYVPAPPTPREGSSLTEPVTEDDVRAILAMVRDALGREAGDASEDDDPEDGGSVSPAGPVG